MRIFQTGDNYIIYRSILLTIMNKTLRTILIMVITFAVIISIFWFILPMTDIPDQLGNSYFIVAIIGSIGISYLVSWGLGKVMK